MDYPLSHSTTITAAAAAIAAVPAYFVAYSAIVNVSTATAAAAALHLFAVVLLRWSVIWVSLPYSLDVSLLVSEQVAPLKL